MAKPKPFLPCIPSHPVDGRLLAQTTAAAARVAGSARNLVVDLAVGELVDLVVVLVAHAGPVGEVVDFWRWGCQ